MSVSFELIAEPGCPPVPPHDCHSCASEGLAIPQHDGFALIGDANGRRRTVLGDRLRFQNLVDAGQGCCPDLVGSCSTHPSGEALETPSSPSRDNACIAADEQRGDPSGACINSQNRHSPDPSDLFTSTLDALSARVGRGDGGVKTAGSPHDSAKYSHVDRRWARPLVCPQPLVDSLSVIPRSRQT